MAAVGPATDQATDLLQKLSLDSKKKTHDAPEVTDKASADTGEVPNIQIPPSERSVTPLLQECMDQSRWYSSTPYYYGGYEGLVNEWDDYRRVDVPPPGVYGDMYHHGYRYAPYSPYPSPTSPVPTITHDGQLYGPPHYQYQAQYYQLPTPHPASGTPHKPVTSQGEVSTTVAAENPAVPLDTAKGNSNATANGKSNSHSASIQPRSNHQNSPLPSNGSYGRGFPPGSLLSGCQDPRFGFDGMRSPTPWYDGSGLPDGYQRVPTTSSAPSAISHVVNTTSGRSQNLHPLPNLMGLHTPRPTSCIGPTAPGFVNRMYTNNRIYGQYGQCGTAFRTGLGFGSNGYHYRMNSRWGSVTDKYKPRGRGNVYYGYGSDDLDGLSELNRGPRGGHFKNTQSLGPNISIAVKGQNLPANGNDEEASVAPARDQYNRDDFLEKYSNGKFFVIKSYSEDDVHKSVKYSVWASTPNGNKKLDAAYQEAQKVADGCPVFLFFSVNTSGQFVGVAEMMGPVDFNKTVNYWQQDKWNGCFPVKWHIVKDVPNSILKHITLENNDNKPVTNSRDTQEVKVEQGVQMLKIFKEHVSKTSILDDFAFYETRQKAMQEKNSKLQQIHKQVTNMKAIDVVDEKEKILPNGKSWLQKPLETVSILKKESSKGTQAEQKPPEENGAASVSQPVTEKHVVANGVANTC
ncbi:YTH domain-containing protein ECT4-like isoform X2 [Dioscorea cayenensis subsp. rotundata]|uniref:YTH domain-containing family protein n=1 Tax=Dioscorea cayennensis subsp. rotundata TaxID=55577 RepID=A0AB40CKZ3_DIOCR|nr:YTH domain-containing protein ECT4-like isoform X2 [Dioscorea cayenensis subsp. rotundata]